MGLIPRLVSRQLASRPRRRPMARLKLQLLEDRAVPSFGFGSAFGFGGAGADYGIGIALDTSGNVYVSGMYQGTVDFDPNHTNPTSNHVLAASGDYANFAAKYLADGTFQWATDLGANANGAPYETVAVQGPNVFVGYSTGAPGDTLVARLDTATGTTAWTITVASGGAIAAGVAAGPAGGVYVTGANAAAQAFVSRLDASGATLWTRTSSGGSAYGSRPAVDGSGNVYVSGSYTGTTAFGSTTLTSWSGTQDAFVWKLDAGGSSVWAGSMGSNGTDYAKGIALDGSGNLLVTGGWGAGSSTASQNNNFNPNSGTTIKLTNHGGFDIYIAKLAPATNGGLALSWAKDIGSYGDDWGQGVAVDGAGNIYTTGLFTGTVNFNPNNGKSQYLSSGGGGGIFVSKLDASGKYVAAAGMSGAANSGGNGRAIALDASGNVFTTGVFSGTVNFNPNGTYNLTSNGSVDAFVSKLTQTSPQLAVSRGPNAGVVPLTQAQLDAAEAAAIRDWAAAGLPAADIARMKAVKADIVTLGGNHLGAAELNGTEVALDATADGWGWSVDVNAKPAAGRMDLLTVVLHELGHVVGLDSRFAGDPHDLMSAYLNPGERRLPGPADGVAALGALAQLRSPTPSAEDRIDWLATAATLKPKSTLLADWQLGHRDAAAKAYAETVAWAQANMPNDTSLRALRAEARDLLGIKGGNAAGPNEKVGPNP
jgi:Beta-propeller repeat